MLSKYLFCVGINTIECKQIDGARKPIFKITTMTKTHLKYLKWVDMLCLISKLCINLFK